MARSQCRKFDWVDAAIFGVALCVGIALVCVEFPFRWGLVRDAHVKASPPSPGESFPFVLIDSCCRVLALLLSPVCLASLVVRLRKPRPRRVRLWGQPGFWPGVACLGIVVPNLLVEVPNLIILHAPESWKEYLLHRLSVSGDQPIGWAIIVAWTILAVGRRWRPERSWIDRTGRALGIAMVALSLVADLNLAVHDLVERRFWEKVERGETLYPTHYYVPPAPADDAPFLRKSAKSGSKEH